MATKTINDLTDLNSVPADTDAMIIRDSSGPNDRKILAGWFAKTQDGIQVLFPTGGGVGVLEAKAQTLTNKTLTTPTIADLTNMTHDHSANSAGGALSSSYPTLTSTSTLTNKTLTAPVVTTPTLTLKNSATPTPTAEGDIQWDSDGDFIVVGDGTGQKNFSSDTGTATLTNKTLTTPTIASFANATHDHTDAAGGSDLNIVTPTSTDTLTNKTLTTPTIGDFTNATHTHADAAGGGATLTSPTITTPTLTLKQGAAPTPTAEGDIQWDTDGNFLVIGDGAAAQTFASIAGTATLTNKTLTTPTIASFVNATHDHTDAAGGGDLSIVTPTSTDTLTNKTLTAPVIASFASATHDHQAANKGGALGSNYVTLTGSQTLTNKTLTAPDMSAATINDGDSGGTAAATADDLVVENSGNAGISILSATGQTSRINLGNADDRDGGYLQYSPSGGGSLTLVSGGQTVVIGQGDATLINNLQISGGTKTSSATGVSGMISYDANYIYVCTATDTWERAALTGGY